MDDAIAQQIQDAVNTIFPILFPNIKCKMPRMENNKINIPFLWNAYPHRPGEMVYEILSKESISLNAFSSSPLASLYCGAGIDWIQMKYLTKPPEISAMEKALVAIICERSL